MNDQEVETLIEFANWCRNPPMLDCSVDFSSRPDLKKQVDKEIAVNRKRTKELFASMVRLAVSLKVE